MQTALQHLDPSRIEALQARWKALRLGTTGRVYALIETPVPGVHVTRQRVEVIPGKGFAGDHAQKAYFRGEYVPGREVSAITREILHLLDITPVTVGDNLITQGFDLATLEPGDRIRIGTSVILERSPRPHRPCNLFLRRTSSEAFALVGQDRNRGALFIVIRGGTIQIGDRITRISG